MPAEYRGAWQHNTNISGGLLGHDLYFSPDLPFRCWQGSEVEDGHWWWSGWRWPAGSRAATPAVCFHSSRNRLGCCAGPVDPDHLQNARTKENNLKKQKYSGWFEELKCCSAPWDKKKETWNYSRRVAWSFGTVCVLVISTASSER